jgi:hypothetical protein
MIPPNQTYAIMVTVWWSIETIDFSSVYTQTAPVGTTYHKLNQIDIYPLSGGKFWGLDMTSDGKYGVTANSA